MGYTQKPAIFKIKLEQSQQADSDYIWDQNYRKKTQNSLWPEGAGLDLGFAVMSLKVKNLQL